MEQQAAEADPTHVAAAAVEADTTEEVVVKLEIHWTGVAAVEAVDPVLPLVPMRSTSKRARLCRPIQLMATI